MPAKLKYGEPTQMISIRVPQSRKEEIRELVRGALTKEPTELEENIYEIRKVISQFVNSIETGEITKDERGIVYTQTFGESFLKMIKEFQLKITTTP